MPPRPAVQRYTRTARGLLIASAALLTGCTIHVTPPVAPRNPVPIFIVDYGQHASLILTRSDETLAEFAYGEWGYFALGRTGWHRAIGAVFWPTPGTLGTRNLPGPPQVDHLRHEIAFDHLYELPVERAAAAALIERLDAAVQAERRRAVYNKEWDLTCVPYPELYCLFCQCNSMIAGWLRELGCRVRGPSLLADFQVDSQPGEPPACPPPS